MRGFAALHWIVRNRLGYRVSHATSLILTAAGCAMLASCTSTGVATGTPTVRVAPVCALFVKSSSNNPSGSVNARSDTAIVAERTDPNVFHGFTRLRRLSGPRGNPAVGFTPDTYAINEAWLRNPLAPVVFRAQAHPARRAAFNDFKASAWSINAQDASGVWSRVLAVGSANPGNEEDTAAAGALTVPQLMPVGLANPQMFACAGDRSDDNTVRTTSLFEVTVPDAASRNPGGVSFIQDLLNGDDRFVPNRPGPLIGPANPPTPRLTSPGNHARDGSVRCAMSQFEDNLATRELHMLTIDNGVLYHAMANNFSAATSGSGSTFDRFNTVSSWGDVGQALGGGFGTILSATIVASRQTAVSLFFVARSGNTHRLWHAVRYSANGGSWRPADDVLALSGGAVSGIPDPFHVAAGVCPVFGEEAVGAGPGDTELVYVMHRPDREMTGGRIVSTPRQWSVGLPGTHSPLTSLTSLMSTSSDTSRQHTLESLSLSTRPFRDDAVPPP